MQVSKWPITVSNIYLNQTRATIHVGHYPRLVIIIISSVFRVMNLSTRTPEICWTDQNETWYDVRGKVLVVLLIFYFFEIAEFTKFRPSEKTVEFSTLSDSLEIWYMGYIRYPEHDGAKRNCLRFSVFARNSLNSRKFELCPISMKIGILGLFDMGNTMVVWKFIFEPSEISTVRKKRPNFQLSPIGLKFCILGILGILKMMVNMKFSCDRNFGRPKKRPNFQLSQIGFKFGILGISGIPKMMVVMKFLCDRNFGRPNKRPNFQLSPIGLKFGI